VNPFSIVKTLIKKIYRKIGYSWYLPYYLKLSFISRKIFLRKWYLSYLPTNFNFDEHHDQLGIIRDKSIAYFDNKLKLPLNSEIIKSGTNLTSNDKEEIVYKCAYRYILNPLIAVPELKDFLKGKNIASILSKTKDLKIVGLNLRISDGYYIEEKTTCYHRDFNGFQTIKIFIPLLNSKDSFLEYFPNTVIRNPWLPFYNPGHIRFKDLRRNFKLSNSIKTNNKEFIGTILNTSCIHRELPSSCKRLNIIITLLPHLDYGKSGMKINEKESIYYQLNKQGQMEMIYI